MSIPNQDRVTSYAPTELTTEFEVGFTIFDIADVEVWVDGEVIAPSAYEVSGTLLNGRYDDAVVTLDEAVEDVPVKIVGSRAPRTNVAFTEGYGVPARDQNTALDTLTAVTRELYAKVARAILAAPGVTPPSLDDIEIPEDGEDGNTILFGAGAPAAELGVNGNFYLNTLNYDFYGPKTAGAWGSPQSLLGPSAGPIPTSEISATTFTFDPEVHQGRLLHFTHASGCLVTLPDDPTPGDSFLWKQALGAGQITFQLEDTNPPEHSRDHSKSFAEKATGSCFADHDGVWTLAGDTDI